ncbi:MAG: YfcE family phosphodiesterase [Candidatus Blackburnbacteria bacterium]|nr:YfcE family phosphodiesterase [Candidatus Blackburnbacteria bacterium]
MKVLAISDTHGNINNIRHVVGFAKSEKFGAIFHCGDFSTTQDVAEVLCSGLPLYAVTGNADEARYDEIWSVLDSNSAVHCAPDVLEFTLDGRKIAMAHQPEKVSGQIKSGNFDAVFHGHLHTAARVEMCDKTLVVNPGALGATTKPSFAVYDTTTNTAEIIDIPI